MNDDLNAVITWLDEPLVGSAVARSRGARCW